MMGTVLNDTAFSQLIDENIEWLMKQESTLENGHIIECLKWLRREREAGNLADRAGEVNRSDLKVENRSLKSELSMANQRVEQLTDAVGECGITINMLKTKISKLVKMLNILQPALKVSNG